MVWAHGLRGAGRASNGARPAEIGSRPQVLSGFVCAPMELVMIQQQRFGTSLFATPSKVVAEAGVGSLFGRGLFMSCGREGVFTAGMLGLGPVMRRYASEKMGYSVSARGGKRRGALEMRSSGRVPEHPVEILARS